MDQPTTANRAEVERLLAYGVWGLPVYSLLLVLGTLTHQPDYTTDFPAYARYVTTDVFLAGHLGASIAGAVFGVLGIGCVAILLAQRGPHPGRTLLAGGFSIAGNLLSTALFGVAAFAQPAIGRAYLAGNTTVAEDLNSEVYGTALALTAVTGLLLLTVGAVMLGLAMVRADQRLRWPGIVYAVSVPVFVVTGLPGLVLQPIAAAALTVAAVVVAVHLSHLSRPATSPDVRPQTAS